MAAQRVPRVALGLAMLMGFLALTLQACSDTKTLSVGETKKLLRELPYRIEFKPVTTPEDASGAVAGVAHGPHRTVLRFGVSLGRGGDPVSLGPNSNLANATGGKTFRVTTDDMIVVGGKLRPNPRLETSAQWKTSATIAVDIEQKLCRAAEGEPCAI